MWWRRGAKREESETLPAQAPSAGEGQAQRGASVVTLRLMTEDEYAAMRAAIEDDYAQNVGRVTDMSIEEARAAAAKQFGELLKNGIATEGHYLWKIIADPEGAVGDLWAFVDPGKRRAFIYFIGTDEQHRGKGYGKAAMLALEAAVRPMGVDHIDLNVFGDNTSAIRLYEGLGYRPTAITMRKQL